MKLHNLLRKHNASSAASSSPFLQLALSFPVPQFLRVEESNLLSTAKTKSVTSDHNSSSKPSKWSADEIEDEVNLIRHSKSEEKEKVPQDLMEEESRQSEEEGEKEQAGTTVSQEEQVAHCPQEFNLASSPPNQNGNFVEINSFSSPE